VSEEELLKTNPNLISSIKKLNELNLLKDYELHKKKFTGRNNRILYVYNDFHTKTTNAGVYFFIYFLIIL